MAPQRIERCILVGVDLRGRPARATLPRDRLTAEESIAELAELARGAGAQVEGHSLQVRDRLVPATLLGSGKLREIQAWAAEVDCDFVLFDHDLSASQHRNLERELGVPVLDRTQLILDIFAKHARSREGRLQVELAQLSYLLPRLVGRGMEMSRLGGGVGTRGPGETQLEHDRRRVRTRIVKLQSEIDKVRSTRRLQRAKRSSVPIPTVALCGYTNAGKSTLFNRLTAANVVADQRMFATLDPTIRKLRLPSNRPALISDTVGFIRNLPPTLIQAFKATLEEVTQATLILHVVDVSASNRRVHREEVEGVLEELGARSKPQLVVLNKCDLVPAGQRKTEVDREQYAGTSAKVVAISATTGEGVEALIRAVDELLARGLVVRERYRVPYDDGGALATLYDHARVLEREDREDGIFVTAEISRLLATRLTKYATTGEAGPEGR